MAPVVSLRFRDKQPAEGSERESVKSIGRKSTKGWTWFLPLLICSSLPPTFHQLRYSVCAWTSLAWVVCLSTPFLHLSSTLPLSRPLTVSILAPKCQPHFPVWGQTRRRKLYFLQVVNTVNPPGQQWHHCRGSWLLAPFLHEATLFRGLGSVFQSVQDHFVQSESGKD